MTIFEIEIIKQLYDLVVLRPPPDDPRALPSLGMPSLGMPCDCMPERERESVLRRCPYVALMPQGHNAARPQCRNAKQSINQPKTLTKTQTHQTHKNT